MVVTVKVGVTNIRAVDTSLPFTAASYQAYPPDETEAVSTAELPAQMVAPEAISLAGGGRTVTLTAALGLMHPLASVICT